MNRVPPSTNCMGGGRSTFVCHAGTMDRRRGDSYLGKEFSQPPGLPDDVHVQKKLACVDCHLTGEGGMGHIERKATCQDCHIEVEESIAAGVHKNVSCEACHVQVLGGYEMTSWGPGEVLGKRNPFKKYSLYYGPQQPPLLIKDQRGKWIPVKVWPNSAPYLKDTIASKPGLIWRWPNGETQDAYALLGTFSFPGGNNNYLAWLQVEQAAHPLGKSRACESCHGSETQVANVTWEFYDSQGAEPFTGGQKVVADRKMLRVKDIRATSKITLMEGGQTRDFAAWLHLGDIWKTRGDFLIPKADPEKYRDLEKGIDEAMAKLRDAERELKSRELRGEEVKKLRRRWKEAKAAAVHASVSITPSPTGGTAHDRTHSNH